MHVLATMPFDLGRLLDCGTIVLTIQEGPCERCGKPSDLVVEKDVTPEGSVPMYACRHCASMLSREKDRYLSAFDVPDRLPRSGHLFVVCETIPSDPEHHYVCCFRSYRSATSCYRQLVDRAKPQGGVVPNTGVQELSLTECDALGLDTASERKRLLVANPMTPLDREHKISLIHQMYIACFTLHNEEERYHGFFRFCAEVFSTKDPYAYLNEMATHEYYGQWADGMLHGELHI